MKKESLKKALKEFGKDFQAISDLLKDRNQRQVRSHYYNSQEQLKKKSLKRRKLKKTYSTS
ncbi:SANT/Myb_domain [Hexamita inflata]|uniref:SANT/Myb domain n=1 Tax=Hexamita inflata TaxID=28002 RepID=A0AA86TQD0_9EUKA|nr:SANT/Myb domain [Hexamita inflata]